MPDYDPDYKFTYTSLKDVVRELTMRDFRDRHQQQLENTLVFRDLQQMAVNEDVERVNAILGQAGGDDAV